MVNYSFFLLICAWSAVHSSDCRNLFSADLHEIRDIVLEEGKPLQLQTPYTKLQFCFLNGTIYSDTFSQLKNVTELRICESNIDKIERGALCTPELKTLELDFYRVRPPPINKDIFENCNIEELIFKFSAEDGDYKIDNDALINLTSLKKLFLQGYNLQHLQKNFLKLPHNKLTVLAFSFCNIHDIDADVFEDLTDLEEIVIIHNPQLTTLSKHIFKNNLNLKKLILRSNAFTHMTWDEFNGLTSVEVLNLAENRISEFNEVKIAKYLPKLKSLYINLNPPPCKQKEAFANQLKRKLKSVEVTYKFDPGYYDSCEEK